MAVTPENPDATDDSTPSQIFAARFRTERLRQGVSQRRLTRLVRERTGTGVSETVLTKIEAGRQLPTLDQAAYYADALGVPLSVLIAPPSYADELTDQIRLLQDQLLQAQQEAVRLRERISTISERLNLLLSERQQLKDLLSAQRGPSQGEKEEEGTSQEGTPSS